MLFYASKLRLFVFMRGTLCLFCQFDVSLAYESLIFSIVFGCFNALKMSGFDVFLLQINVSKSNLPKTAIRSSKP